MVIVHEEPIRNKGYLTARVLPWNGSVQIFVREINSGQYSKSEYKYKKGYNQTLKRMRK